MSAPLAPEILDKFRALVDAAGFVVPGPDMARYLTEWRERYQGEAAAVLKPSTTDEVSRVLSLAHETGTPVVPQGGGTGLVGGQLPFDAGAIVLSLERMNAVRVVDPLNNTITVESGCVLAAIQEQADSVDRLFPLSLASEGSCQIGGNLSTNAGGTAVLRYGNARDLVLGLEVVLPDGRVWDGLRGLRKDNTGYDLKHLFLGSEGTLGVITAAVLKLFPKPRSVETAIAAVPDPAAAVAFLSVAGERSGGLITAFELMPRIGIEFVLRHAEGTREPLAEPHDWYVLVELSSGQAQGDLRTTMEDVLAAGVEAGLVRDATIAQSRAQGADFWRLRETMSEVQKKEGGSIKHDISVPVSRMADFIAQATEAVTAELPDVRPMPFGHIGDGNVHFNLSQPVGMDKDAYMALWGRMNRIVHAIALEMGGSISAEHGVGILKRDEIASTKPPVEIELMRTLKTALDPKGILNPGKVVSTEG